jgi:hypothetical protein
MFALLKLAGLALKVIHTQNCQNVPGSPGYPTDTQWKALGESVSGRLVRTIPSGQYCPQTNCTDVEWTSANWPNTVPGAMNMVSGYLLLSGFSLKGFCQFVIQVNFEQVE